QFTSSRMTCTTIEASPAMKNVWRLPLPTTSKKRGRQDLLTRKPTMSSCCKRSLVTTDSSSMAPRMSCSGMAFIRACRVVVWMLVSMVSSVDSKQSTTHSVWPSAHLKELQ
ncbi:unnamed protein product, partial [Aphanomyces euteiches]